MAVIKDGFKDNPAVVQELDLVEEEDQFTHIGEMGGRENVTFTVMLFNM